MPMRRKKLIDAESIVALVAIAVLGGLIALGIDGPLKGGLLMIIGYFFGKPIAADIVARARKD